MFNTIRNEMPNGQWKKCRGIDSRVVCWNSNGQKAIENHHAKCASVTGIIRGTTAVDVDRVDATVPVLHVVVDRAAIAATAIVVVGVIRAAKAHGIVVVDRRNVANVVHLHDRDLARRFVVVAMIAVDLAVAVEAVVLPAVRHRLVPRTRTSAAITKATPVPVAVVAAVATRSRHGNRPVAVRHFHRQRPRLLARTETIREIRAVNGNKERTA